jgi:hypothetical protein
MLFVSARSIFSALASEPLRFARLNPPLIPQPLSLWAKRPGESKTTNIIAVIKIGISLFIESSCFSIFSSVRSMLQRYGDL